MTVDHQKELLLKGYIENMIYRFMIVQNRFLQKSAAGLSMSELRIISFIGDNKRCIMREISESLLIPKTNLTAIMNKLVRKEIVSRERTEEDRRMVYVGLTESGDELYRQIMSSHLELSRGMLEALDESEQDDMFKILGKIAR